MPYPLFTKGWARASSWASSMKPIRQAILDEGLIPKERLDEILNLKKLTEGGRA